MFNPKKDNFKFSLGDDVVDIITGFTGIIIYRSQWLHNCNTYGVRSRELKDGKIQDLQAFDEPQLKIKKEKVVKEKRETGGPCPAITKTNRF